MNSNSLPTHPSPLETIQQWGIADEYPFEPQTLDLQGLSYRYVDHGAGDPLLFVHGNPTWSFAWRNLIKPLSQQYRCVAVDHIGCGLSDKPQQYAYELETHIGNLVQLIESLDLKNITLIAHDWGGAIGTGAATRLPDRFQKIVLMNTAAFRSKRMPLRIAACRIPVLGQIGVRGLNLFAGLATKMAVEKTTLSAAVKKGYLAPYDNWRHRVAIDRFVKDIPLNSYHPSYDTLLEMEEFLPLLKEKPMLLPWGMRDWCFSPHFLKEFQQRFPHAETVPFEQAGHYLFEEEPEGLLNAIQNFLKDS